MTTSELERRLSEATGLPSAKRDAPLETPPPCPFCGTPLTHYAAGVQFGREHNGWWSHASWGDFPHLKEQMIGCPTYAWRAWDDETTRLDAWTRRALATQEPTNGK